MDNALRMIPLTDEFIKNKKIYDRIWVTLQLNSFLGKDEENQKHRWIFQKFEVNFNSLYEMVNITDDSGKNYISYNTCKMSYELLKEIGYLIPGKIVEDCFKRTLDVFYLKEDFIPYKLIPYNTLDCLLDIPKKNIFKIYAVLLNWNSFKKNYRFTLEQLSNAIGYSSKYIYTNIKQVLSLLQDLGLIKYYKKRIAVENSNQMVEYYFLENTSLNIKLPEKNDMPEKFEVNPGEFVF